MPGKSISTKFPQKITQKTQEVFKEQTDEGQDSILNLPSGCLQREREVVMELKEPERKLNNLQPQTQPTNQTQMRGLHCPLTKTLIRQSRVMFSNTLILIRFCRNLPHSRTVAKNKFLLAQKWVMNFHQTCYTVLVMIWLHMFHTF